MDAKYTILTLAEDIGIGLACFGLLAYLGLLLGIILAFLWLIVDLGFAILLVPLLVMIFGTLLILVSRRLNYG